ncbi:MAG: RIP metalloprotease RseP [Woeseiaceae bacterium]|nr:RIP metalloprotease RseP [Woeseiaceae bacterium]
MMDVLSSILAFVVAISVLVAVHEYGHYIVGKWSGMKVLRFSIGFGKPLYKKVAGPDQTEYCISAIPLGGYVRFLDSREAAVDPSDDGRAFDQRPIPLRIATLLAGPFFNFAFAIVAYWALFIYGVPTVVPAVGEVEPESYAAEAGLLPGDRIIAVGDRETADWEATLLAMLDRMVATGSIPLTLEDDDGFRRQTAINVGDDASRLTEPGLLFDGLGFRPWGVSDIPAIIGELTEDSPAGNAGLVSGDRITRIDGVTIDNFSDLVEAVSTRADRSVEVVYERGGETFDTVVNIASMERDGQTVGRLGVAAGVGGTDYVYLKQFGPLDSVGRAIQRTWDSTLFTVRMLARMVTGDVSVKNISGPINIAQFAGDSAERGLSSFLGFLAIVSISLGVLNLLPIPILDGGQIVYQTIEGLKGSPLSERAQIAGQQFGILALLILMSFAFYNDLARIFG